MRRTCTCWTPEHGAGDMGCLAVIGLVGFSIVLGQAVSPVWGWGVFCAVTLILVVVEWWSSPGCACSKDAESDEEAP